MIAAKRKSSVEKFDHIKNERRVKPEEREVDRKHR